MRRRRVLLPIGFVALGLALVVAVRGQGDGVIQTIWEPDKAETVRDVIIEPDFQVTRIRTLPEHINSLYVATQSGRAEVDNKVFAGLSGSGQVFRLMPGSNADPFVVSMGLGDDIRNGTCFVNKLGLHDLDGDGLPELIGSTSQVNPRGRPRLLIWDTKVNATAERAVARPLIRSSWSHSLGYMARPDGRPDSLFVTFCGYGEVVEYRLDAGKSADDGFHHDQLMWKQVGQMPASGEWLEVADVDHDGVSEVCVATGFVPNAAAIQFLRSPAIGAPLELLRSIDEGKRFGNVRFTIAPIGDRKRNQIVAWWCTDIAGGDAEMCMYEIGQNGNVDRTVVARGPAAELWPDDGQFVVGDLDRDGRSEVWFTTGGGVLQRFEPGAAKPLRLMARFARSIGPVAVGHEARTGRPRLYLGQGNALLMFEPKRESR